MIFARIQDSQPFEFDTMAECVDCIARREIDPLQVVRVDLDINSSSDISEDVACDAWLLMRPKCDPFQALPDFIQRNVSGIEDTIEEMQQEAIAPRARMSQGELV